MGGGAEEPGQISEASVLSLPEGTFMGEAKHKDGSLMAIVFQVGKWHCFCVVCMFVCLFCLCMCVCLFMYEWGGLSGWMFASIV